VGFSRKVSEPNYGSRGASVHLEMELDRAALDDPERLQTEIEAIFEQARGAVERELERHASPPRTVRVPVSASLNRPLFAACPPLRLCVRSFRSAILARDRKATKVRRLILPRPDCGIAIDAVVGNRIG